MSDKWHQMNRLSYPPAEFPLSKISVGEFKISRWVSPHQMNYRLCRSRLTCPLLEVESTSRTSLKFQIQATRC